MTEKQQLPKEWDTAIFGKIIDFEKKTKRKAGDGKESGKYKFFTSSEKQEKYFDGYDFNGPHLIFATGGRSAVHYCDEKFSVTADCFVIKLKDKIIPKYAYYFFFGNLHLLERGFRGAGLKHLSKKYLEGIEIPHPKNKTTQKKIVSILEKAEQIKNWRKEANELSKNYLPSVFYEMFGDPYKNPMKLNIEKMKNVAIIIMGQSPRGDTYNKLELGTPLLNGPTEFGRIHPKEKQWTTEPRKLCQKEDILFCVRGATAGRMNLADKEYCLGRGVCAIRGKNNVTNEYIFEFLKIKYDYFQSTGQGSTFINISKDNLNNLLIPIPDKSKIDIFVKKAKIASRLLEDQNTSKIASGNLFNSLMQKAFKGELLC